MSDGYLITLLQLLFPLSPLLCYTIQILCYAGRHPQADAGPSGMPRGCGMVWKSMPKDCVMVWYSIPMGCGMVWYSMPMGCGPPEPS